MFIPRVGYPTERGARPGNIAKTTPSTAAEATMTVKHQGDIQAMRYHHRATHGLPPGAVGDRGHHRNQLQQRSGGHHREGGNEDAHKPFPVP